MFVFCAKSITKIGHYNTEKKKKKETEKANTGLFEAPRVQFRKLIGGSKKEKEKRGEKKRKNSAVPRHGEPVFSSSTISSSR